MQESSVLRIGKQQNAFSSSTRSSHTDITLWPDPKPACQNPSTDENPSHMRLSTRISCRRRKHGPMECKSRVTKPFCPAGLTATTQKEGNFMPKAPLKHRYIFLQKKSDAERSKSWTEDLAAHCAQSHPKSMRRHLEIDPQILHTGMSNCVFLEVMHRACRNKATMIVQLLSCTSRRLNTPGTYLGRMQKGKPKE